MTNAAIDVRVERSLSAQSLEKLFLELLEQCKNWDCLPEAERIDQAYSCLTEVTDRLRAYQAKHSDTERLCLPPPPQEGQVYLARLAPIPEPVTFDNTETMKAWLEGTWETTPGQVEPPPVHQGLAEVAPADELEGDCSACFDEMVRQETKLAELSGEKQRLEVECDRYAGESTAFRTLLKQIKATLDNKMVPDSDILSGIKYIMKSFTE
jgi:hypothetical protein